jgi:hypothetical protein
MPDPVFSEADRVSTTQLPAELRGVTDPLKIAAYYQQREATLRQEMRNQTPPQNPPNTTVRVETPTQTPPQTATFSVQEANAARETLIASARSVARQGKKYWDRLSEKIEALMQSMDPADKVNSQVWETCYNTLVGQNINTLLDQDKASEAEANRIASERSAAAAAPGAVPPPLPVEVTSKVLPGLGLSEAQYREAQDHIAKGVWPLTAENVSGKRVLIGSEK